MSTSQSKPLGTYEPQNFESHIYDTWKKQGYFQPSVASDEPFVIVIPPPNVTGVLHMGHGLNNSLQDVLIRYHRMLGKSSLWVPGTDHAGIATQHMVERQLREQGTSRLQCGREQFVKEAWKFKKMHHAIIRKQLEMMGASCDWERERFTMDEGLSRAVREMFVRLYEDGLIYRGNYLVNWCHTCGTAISDEEVTHHEIDGMLYHYRYPIISKDGGTQKYIEIATTRPETMLGDTAVAIHPDDPRYTGLAGASLELPLTGRQIPVIADKMVVQEFGSGAVKITPGHDFNDWQMGQRHDLPVINILSEDGRLNDNVPEPYRGLTVQEARAQVHADLEAQGYAVRMEQHRHQVGHCYRCSTVIEPYLSRQWFVRMKPLAEKALALWHNGKIRFYPDHWAKTYTEWLMNIRDWCISRQLWWGHRIPVWYDEDTGEVIVSRDDPTAQEQYRGRHLRQDEDVLDTWFSSWLWPFSVMGWPDETADFKKYFPTSTLVTGYDIIFFWVSRMIMASAYLFDTAPFRDIYLTGLIRDKQGRKMAKSLKNGIDPIEIIQRYGADSLKFTITYMASLSQDISIDHSDFQLGSRFANKLWNAARFVSMMCGDNPAEESASIEQNDLRTIDRWIYQRLNETIGAIHRAMELYRFNDACHVVYEFVWNDFCDWYLELAKPALKSTDRHEYHAARAVLIDLIEIILRIVHPFMSFITEELYQKLIVQTGCARNGEGSIMVQPYPLPHAEWENKKLDRQFSMMQHIVHSIRTAKSETQNHEKVPIVLALAKEQEFVKQHDNIICHMARISDIDYVEDIPSALDSTVEIGFMGDGFSGRVHISEKVQQNMESIVERRGKERVRLEKLVAEVEARLAHKSFMEKAPPAVRARQEQLAHDLKRQLSDIKKSI